jgi:hypothetical protein
VLAQKSGCTYCKRCKDKDSRCYAGNDKSVVFVCVAVDEDSERRCTEVCIRFAERLRGLREVCHLQLAVLRVILPWVFCLEGTVP